MIIAIVSIFLISGVVWTSRKIWPSFKICPVCAGVSGTWLWMFTANHLGYPADLAIIGLLMGGSVVGTAYQLEKRVRPNKASVWKILFIPAGFSLAYNLIYFSWFYVLLMSAIIFLLLFIFLDWPVSKISANRADRVKDIEKEMENCC